MDTIALRKYLHVLKSLYIRIMIAPSTSAYAIRRVAIFYDGSSFQKFNNWCKHKLK